MAPEIAVLVYKRKIALVVQCHLSILVLGFVFECYLRIGVLWFRKKKVVLLVVSAIYPFLNWSVYTIWGICGTEVLLRLGISACVWVCVLGQTLFHTSLQRIFLLGWDK